MNNLVKKIVMKFSEMIQNSMRDRVNLNNKQVWSLRQQHNKKINHFKINNKMIINFKEDKINKIKHNKETKISSKPTHNP